MELEGELAGEIAIPAQTQDEYGNACAVTAVLTPEGFDMDYFGSMLIHFEAGN